VGQRKLEGLAERKRGREEEISGTMVVERKERGFVTLCDKSVLLHKDFFLLSSDYVLLHRQNTNCVTVKIPMWLTKIAMRGLC